MSDWWRQDLREGRFVREAPDAWHYGPADPRLAGLRVPGARDVTLGEIAQPDIDPPHRGGGFVFFRASVVAREPALNFVGGPAIGEYLGVPVAEWRPREGDVIGMRAPELGDGAARDVALAEREVRLWRRVKTHAARRRASLVLHSRQELRVAGADVARWIGVSRSRVQQLSDGELDRTAPQPRSAEEAKRALATAHREFLSADRMLHRAESIRRRRVADACDAGGLSLGAVARILDVSRARAQQLRDTGRLERDAA